MDRFSGEDHDYSNDTWLLQGFWDNPDGYDVNDWGFGVTGIANNTDYWVVAFHDAHGSRPMRNGMLAVACLAPQRSIPDLGDFNGGLFGIGGPNDEASSHFLYTRSELNTLRFECQYRVSEAGVIEHLVNS